MTPEGSAIVCSEEKTVPQVVSGGGVSARPLEVAFPSIHALSRPMGKGVFSVRLNGGGTEASIQSCMIRSGAGSGAMGRRNGTPGEHAPNYRRRLGRDSGFQV